MRRPALLLLLLSVVATAIVYGRTLGFDLTVYDFYYVHPWSPADLGSVWHGSFDPMGVTEPFYRPLTAMNHAALFYFFGLNTRAMFVVSLAESALVTWLLALVVLRERGSVRLASVAALLYIVHPSRPDSTMGWVTAQQHLQSCLIVLACLLVWQTCRTRSARAWWPIGVLATVGLLIKEDTILIVPALIVLQMIWSGWVDDVPLPSRTLLAGVTIWGLAIGGARVGIWHYPFFGTPSWPAERWSLRPLALWRGPYRALLSVAAVPSPVPERFASASMAILCVAGLAAALARPTRPARRLIVIGVVLLACFDVTAFFRDSEIRDHLMTLAGVFVLTGGVAALFDTPSPLIRRAAAVGVVIALCFMRGASGRALNNYAPCAEFNHIGNLVDSDEVNAPTFDIKCWLRQKDGRCAAGTLQPMTRSLDSVVWSAGTPRPDGTRPIGPHTVALISNTAAAVRLRVRDADASPATPVWLSLNADGGTRATLTLTSAEWREVWLPLPRGVWSWLRDMHRVDIDLTTDRGAMPADVELARLELKAG